MNEAFWTFLGIASPEGAHPTSWSTDPSWVALTAWAIVVLLGIALAVVFYRKETVPVGATLQGALVTLRAISIACLAWLVFSPIQCSVHLEGTRPRPIALVLDRSQSMATQDERSRSEEKLRIAALTGLGDSAAKPARIEVGKAILGDAKIDLLASLGKKGPLSWHGAGERTLSLGQAKAGEEPPWKQWSASEARSALGRTVDDLIRSEDAPAAIVMLTDGRQTADLEPDLVEACQKAAAQGIAVHFLGLGAAEPPKLEIRDLDAPEILQAGERILVRLRWRASGLDPADVNARIEISLDLDGAEVAREELPAKEGDDQRTVLAFRVPANSSARTVSALTARARLVHGLNPSAPSKLERQVRITTRPVRILLVDTAPRWDYRFLMMQLAREAPSQVGPSAGAVSTSGGIAVQPSFVILQADADLAAREPFLPGFPSRSELFRFDAVLLGDVDPAKLGADGAESLRRFVEEGGGLIIQSGTSANPVTWAGTPLADLLPIEPDRAGAQPASLKDIKDPFLPVPTPEGLATDSFRLADTPEETVALYASFPGMYRHTPVTRLKPGARSLMAHPTERCATGPVPVLASQSYGRGRVAWLGVDETWRWRFNAGEKHFARFWTQWLLWAAASRSDAPRRVRLSMDRRDPPAGTSGEIRARLLDANFAPDGRDKVPARIQRLDPVVNGDTTDPQPAPASDENGAEVELRSVPGQPGEFSLPLVHDKPGKYRLRLPGDDGPGVEWTVFAPVDAEKTGGLAEQLMQAAALAAGGTYRGEKDAAQLSEAVVGKTRPWSVDAHLPRLHPLWFGLLVCTLGLEWGLRRRNQLS